MVGAVDLVSKREVVVICKERLKKLLFLVFAIPKKLSL